MEVIKLLVNPRDPLAVEIVEYLGEILDNYPEIKAAAAAIKRSRSNG